MWPVKARVWDSVEEKWFEPTWRAYSHEIEEVLLSPAGHVALRTYEGISAVDAVQQRFRVSVFTGLHDKNGTEIYEGDWYECEIGRGEVIHENACFWVFERLRPGLAKFPLFESGGNEFSHVPNATLNGSVIGNIYEHPDLLTSAA